MSAYLHRPLRTIERVTADIEARGGKLCPKCGAVFYETGPPSRPRQFCSRQCAGSYLATRAKLNRELATEIRGSAEPSSDLAARYGVTRQAIWEIRAGLRWAP